MKKQINQKGFSGLEVILFVLLASLVVGGGVYIYTARQVADDSTKTVVKGIETKNALSEDDQILKAAKCTGTTNCKIVNKQSNLAHVVTNGEGGGGHIYLSKEGNSWTIIFEGNGDVPAETVQKYNIPSDWMGPSL
jgi:hypothetical protein